MNTEYPLVTSVVLSYKKFDFLYDAIYSILNQDYPCIELIISDDASGNFPKAEIEEFIKKNKKDNLVNSNIIINEKNLGTVKNFNNALKEGKGEYYICLSGDDIFFEALTMKKIVDRFKETGSDILCCRRQYCQKDLKPIRLMPNSAYLPIIARLNTPDKQFNAFAIWHFYEMASGSATYYAKHFFEKRGYFDETYILWEDGPLYINYTKNGGLLYTAYDIISIKYREGGSSGSYVKDVLRNDLIKLTANEILPYRDVLKKGKKRYVEFDYIRLTDFQKYSLKKRIQFIIKYFDICLWLFSYKVFCKLISFCEEKWYSKKFNKL